MKIQIKGRQIELLQGDITTQQVDAIVNAANSRLAGGGGVDGAIHRGGGPEIMQETNRRYPDGCPTGSAVISGAGELPAKFVIHAVGPIWSGGTEDEPTLLSSAHRRCLELARQNNCDSIAFPAISCGVYGYPIDQASQIALKAAIDFLAEHDQPELVRFVLFGEDVYEVFAKTLTQLSDTQ